MRKFEKVKKYQEKYWNWLYGRSEFFFFGVLAFVFLFALVLSGVSYKYATGSVRTAGGVVAIVLMIVVIYHPVYLIRDMNSAVYSKETD